jgi:hypothetical protein
MNPFNQEKKPKKNKRIAGWAKNIAYDFDRDNTINKQKEAK